MANNISAKFDLLPGFDPVVLNKLLLQLKQSLGEFGKNIKLIDPASFQKEMETVKTAAVTTAKVVKKEFEGIEGKTGIGKGLNADVQKSTGGVMGMLGGFKANLTQTFGQMGNALKSGSLTGALDGVGGSLLQLGAKAGPVGAAVVAGLAAVGGAIVSLYNKGKEIDDIRDGLELLFAGKGLKGDAMTKAVDEMMSSVNKLSYNLDVPKDKLRELFTVAVTAGKSGEAAESFAKQGLAVEKMTGGFVGATEVMKLMNKGMANPENEAVFNRLAAKAPELAAGLKAAGSEQERLAFLSKATGAVLEKMGEQAKSPETAIGRMEKVWGGVVESMATGVFDIVNVFLKPIGDLADYLFTEVLPNVKKAIKDAAAAVVSFVEPIVNFLAPWIAKIAQYFWSWWTILYKIGSIIYDYVTIPFQIVWGIIKSMGEAIGNLFSPFDNLVSGGGIFDKIIAAFNQVGDWLTTFKGWMDEVIGWIVDAIAPVGTFIVEYIVVSFKIWWEILKGLGIFLYDVFAATINIVWESLKVLWSLISGPFIAAWDAITNAISGVIGWFKNLFGMSGQSEGFFSKLIGTVKQAGGIMNTFRGLLAGVSGAFNAFMELIGESWNKLKKLDIGGAIDVWANAGSKIAGGFSKGYNEKIADIQEAERAKALIGGLKDKEKEEKKKEELSDKARKKVDDKEKERLKKLNEELLKMQNDLEEQKFLLSSKSIENQTQKDIAALEFKNKKEINAITEQIKQKEDAETKKGVTGAEKKILEEEVKVLNDKLSITKQLFDIDKKSILDKAAEATASKLRESQKNNIELKIKLGISQDTDLVPLLKNEIEVAQAQLEKEMSKQKTVQSLVGIAGVITPEEQQALNDAQVAVNEAYNKVLAAQQALKDKEASLQEERLKKLEDIQKRKEILLQKELDNQKSFGNAFIKAFEESTKLQLDAQKNADLKALDDKFGKGQVIDPKEAAYNAEKEEIEAKHQRKILATQSASQTLQLENQRQADLALLKQKESAEKEKLSKMDKTTDPKAYEAQLKIIEDMNNQVMEKGDLLKTYSGQLTESMGEIFGNLFAGNEEGVKAGASKLFGSLAAVLKKQLAITVTSQLLQTLSVSGPYAWLASAAIGAVIYAALSAIVDPIINGISSFATGGRVDSPTLAIVGDASNAGSNRNTEWIFRDDQLNVLLVRAISEAWKTLQKDTVVPSYMLPALLPLINGMQELRAGVALLTANVEKLSNLESTLEKFNFSQLQPENILDGVEVRSFMSQTLAHQGRLENKLDSILVAIENGRIMTLNGRVVAEEVGRETNSVTNRIRTGLN